MPITVELTHEVDVEVLQSYLEERLRRHAMAPTAWAMPRFEIESFERILEALKHASGWGIPRHVAQPLVLEGERTVSIPYVEDTLPSPRTVEAQALVLCGAHPHYTAQRKPRTGCVGCWAAYKRVRNVTENEATT